MTAYEAILNQIKAAVSPGWLTPSQRAIFDALEKRYHTHLMVNVSGQRGVGKTLMGWVVHKAHGYDFVHPDLEVADWPPKAILDLETLHREEARRLRAEMLLHQRERALVLTRRPVDDSVVRLQLDLTEQDIKHAKGNFYRHLSIQLLADGDNLHDLVLANIREGHIQCQV